MPRAVQTMHATESPAIAARDRRLRIGLDCATPTGRSCGHRPLVQSPHRPRPARHQGARTPEVPSGFTL